MRTYKAIVANSPRIISQLENITPVVNQCDACSPIIFVKNELIQDQISGVPFLKYQKLIEQAVNSNHYAVLSPLSKSFSVLNKKAMQILEYFRTPNFFDDIPSAWIETWGNELIEYTFRRMILNGLLISNKYSSPIFSEVVEKLTAWLHITDRCNLRCAYCYLPHKSVDMSEERGRAAIDATYRSAIINNYKEVKFKYSGGEPLLRIGLIKDLHRYAHSLADQHKIHLDGIILSNGTLLSTEIIKTMQSLDLRLMISLDELEEYHDLQRFYQNGRGATDVAKLSIDLALQNGLIPDISITVTGRNSNRLSELTNWLLERDLPFTFNFYRENKFSSCHSDLRLEEETIVSGMLDAYKMIETNLPRRSLLTSLVDQSNLFAPHLRTCSVGHSYLVFNHLGQVSKCQMQISKPVTTTNVKDPLSFIRADKSGIQNLSVEEKEDCHSCDWKYWCAGGCPLVTFRETGRYDVKSPNCNIYKILYPEVMRLEGLRLLKYASN